MNMNIFRNHLSERMRREKKTQAALSAEFSVEQASLSRFISGESGLSGDYIFKLWPFVYGSQTPTPRAEGPQDAA